MVLLARSELFDAHFDGVTKHVSWSARIRYYDEVQVDSDANNGRQCHKKKDAQGGSYLDKHGVLSHVGIGLCGGSGR